MARQISMPAQFPPVSLLPPAADAAGRTGGYRSLRYAHKSWIVARVNQGNAAPVTFSILQAQDNAGTGAKAISSVVPIWLNNDTSSSDGFTLQTQGVSFATDATLKDKIVMFELIDEKVLDLANGYGFIALQSSASNAANITEATLISVQRYEQASPPTSYA